MTHAARSGAATLTTSPTKGVVVGLLGLLLLTGTVLPEPAEAVPTHRLASTGSTTMADQVLRSGCHGYGYGYQVSTPTGEWTLETFLLDPDRQRVASNAFDSDVDADPGTSKFWLCRSVTRFGTFKIRGRLTTYDGTSQSSTWITPTYVRLHRSAR